MPVALASPFTDRAAIEDEAQAFQKKADRRVPSITRDLAAALRAARAGTASDLIERGVRQHDWTLIREGIPLLAQSGQLLKAADDHPEDLLNEDLAQTFAQGMRYAVELIPSFELVDQNAVEFARRRAGQLLSDFDANALANAREAVAWGIEHGRTVAETARFLEQSLYLPERAMNAVERYFEGLISRIEKGDSIAEAARAEGKGRALSPKQFLDAKNIDTLVGRYSDRWVDYIAKTAARTMTIEASNAGLREGWNQAAQAGYFNPATAMLAWFATEDDRTCPECQALDGQEVAFADGTWDASIGNVSYPPAHQSCRCTLLLLLDSGATMAAFAA